LIEDLAAVQKYTLELGQQIADGKRNFVKLVLLGIGAEVDEGQMEALDDMDYGGLKDPQGQAIDIWDHKLASEMQKLEEVFAEVVSSETILAPSAEIVDDAGQPVKPIGRASYKDGLPALLEFVMPKSAKSFSLVLPNGTKVVQSVEL
ncbi:MAG: VWA domain-containing protein, partial [Verrucomicrobiota bacterium]